MSTNIRLNTDLIKNLSRVIFMPTAEMIAATGIAPSSWYYMMDKPDNIAIKYLLLIANGLHIPVRRLFTFDQTKLIGRREDYVAEPYLPCHYDNDAFQNIINTRSDTSWQKAAKLVGMSRFRLRNSLLAVTRTPVTRFLTVCESFDIDPFTILIDPNPLPKQKRTASSPSRSTAVGSATHPAHDFSSEITDLHRQIDELKAEVADMRQQYESLLHAHEALARSVQVNIHNFTDSHLSIAAESSATPYDKRVE